ncbi:pogo transposable element with KRAB [Trichonephila clavipes]|nr:pogo transposable element with KRAB [Trichonephila clavipes]
MDSMRAHIKDSVKAEAKKKKYIGAELSVIPGGLTKILQPLDIKREQKFQVPRTCLLGELDVGSESEEITDREDSDAENELSDTLPENILELFNSDTDELDFEGFR